MRWTSKATLSTAISMFVIGGANAADPIMYDVSSAPADAVAMYDDSGFDWTGFYAGVHGVGAIQPGGTEYGLALALGGNVDVGFVLLGAEVTIAALTDGADFSGRAEVLGRAGLLLTDEFVLYGAAGFGTDFAPAGDDHLLLGGGLEMAISDSVSVRGQYLYGVPLTGDETHEISIGANFHF